MKIVFDKLAQLELNDASEYYDLELRGLGSRFREEIKDGIQKICEYPEGWAKEKSDN